MTDKARPCPEDTLKPCPFCGTTKSYVRLPTCKRDDDYDADDRAFPVVRCGECFAEAVGKDWDHKGRSAIAAWNCRSNPSLTAEIERLKEVGPPFSFDRYINGKLMAEGVTIERQATLKRAASEAARLASKGPNGETPVLVFIPVCVRSALGEA